MIFKKIYNGFCFSWWMCVLGVVKFNFPYLGPLVILFFIVSHLLMIKNKKIIMTIFDKCYDKEAIIWFNRWRIFWMSCEELFGYKNGEEWYVGHCFLSKKH